VVARLWPDRFRQGDERARQDREHHGGAGGKRSGRGRILSGHLLVRDAQHSRQKPNSPAPAERQRHGHRDEGASCSGWTKSRPTACYGCHQLGNKATRVIPKELGTFKNSLEAWERRGPIRTGDGEHAAALGRQDAKVSLANFANWTDRIAGGELPFAKPDRPQGVERNVVVTQWDWADPKVYLHDQVSTDKRKPTINAYGKNTAPPRTARTISRSSIRRTNRATMVKMPVRDADMESSRKTPWRRRSIGVTRRSGTPRPACTTHDDERGRCVFHVARRQAGEPSVSARPAPPIRRPRCSDQGIDPAPRLL